MVWGEWRLQLHEEALARASCNCNCSNCSNSNGKGPPILWSLLANVDRSLHPPTNVQCSLLLPFPDGKCCIFNPRPQGSNWINCDTFIRERSFPSNSKYLQKQAFEKRAGLKPCLYTVRQVPYSRNNDEHWFVCIANNCTEWWLFIVWSYSAATPFVDFNWIQQCQNPNAICKYYTGRTSASLYIPFRIRPGQVYTSPIKRTMQVYTLSVELDKCKFTHFLGMIQHSLVTCCAQYAVTSLCYSTTLCSQCNCTLNEDKGAQLYIRMWGSVQYDAHSSADRYIV